MAGLSTTGFTRKTLAQLLDTASANARNTFGNDLNTSDDSVFRQIYGPLSQELDTLWQELQATYSAYTKAGAEGIHLDNFYSFVGIQRLDAAQATETILVGSDGTTPDPTVIAPPRFSNEFGVGFTLTGNTTIGADNTYAYRILIGDLAINTSYTVTLSTTAGVTQTLNVATTNEASRLTALSQIRTFILTTRPDLSTLMVLDSTGLYVGYENTTTFEIPSISFNLTLSPFAGRRYSRFDVRSENRGLQEGRDRDTYSINPTFTGFQEAIGAGAFFRGRNVETDAQYRARAERDINTVVSDSSTAQSIANEVERQAGVVDTAIYENPTNAATTTVPSPYAVHVLAFGGSSADIAAAILRRIPLNIQTVGSSSVQVNNNAGTNVNVRFSFATQIPLDFRIDYDTVDDTLLTISEEGTLRTTIINFVNALGIGQQLNIFTLQSAIVTALGVNRLSALTVNVRQTGNPTYQTTNFMATFEQILRQVDPTVVTFNKI